MTKIQPMNQQTRRLREIMETHQLSAEDVAQILGRSATTVRIWRCRDERRSIPALALRVLEASLGDRPKSV